MEKKIKAKLKAVKADLALVQTEIETEKAANREKTASLMMRTIDEIRLKNERAVLELLLEKPDAVPRGGAPR